ncbi:MAG: hypothetical protein WCE79_26525 [Xanthobacteraceae bacterium]
MKALPAALAICVALSLTSSFAEAKQAKRQKQVKPAPVAEPRRANGFAQQPARMIQAGPGYWISSYGCVMDGGYGRLTPCDLTDHSD